MNYFFQLRLLFLTLFGKIYVLNKHVSDILVII